MRQDLKRKQRSGYNPHAHNQLYRDIAALIRRDGDQAVQQGFRQAVIEHAKEEEEAGTANDADTLNNGMEV